MLAVEMEHVFIHTHMQATKNGYLLGDDFQ